MAENYYDKYVTDDGPKGAKILLVGEAPGENEYLEGKPFVGESGQLLINCLNRAGVSRSEIRLANLCHYRPNKNKFELLLKEQVLVEGLKELYKYIEDYRPTVIGALGAFPLTFLTGRKGIKKWRGSIITYVHDETIKVIPTFHPAAVLRDRGLYPTFDLDIKRIIGDSEFSERRLPERRFIINPRGLECEEWCQRLCSAEYLGTDIETIKGTNRILCVGFSPSPDLAVCFVPEHAEGRRAIERILRSEAKKIFQFGTFDTIQLINENGYEICDPVGTSLARPYFWDTLIAQHTFAPELPRSLEYLTSIYTREPYYKTVGRGTIPDDEKGWSAKVEKQSLYEYNCRDCCCTTEVAFAQMQEMKESNDNINRIFNFQMQLLETYIHISTSGMAYDEERRKMIEEVLFKKWSQKQFILDRLTGKETNVRSPFLNKILYEQLGLPVRKNHKTGRPTTNEDAIVSLITYCKDHIATLKRPDSILEWKVKLGICQLILEIRGIRQVLSNYILAKMRNGKDRASHDGRYRSTFKVGGTETGRGSASKYVDGSGFNAQTLPRDPVEIPEIEQVVKIDALVAQLTNEDESDEEQELEDEAA